MIPKSRLHTTGIFTGSKPYFTDFRTLVTHSLLSVAYPLFSFD
jgi:hypothetical protein